jgi:hypothetical protein
MVIWHPSKSLQQERFAEGESAASGVGPAAVTFEFLDESRQLEAISAIEQAHRPWWVVPGAATATAGG